VNHLRVIQWCVCVVVCGTVGSTGWAIEAVRGKSYSLTPQHGPWMVMVASFRDVPEERRQEGLTAIEAAQELVHELRVSGVPAYVYAQDSEVEKITTKDRLGRDDERIYAARNGMVCVLAGNYPSIDDNTAQQTLKWIKNFEPKFMTAEGSGAIFRVSPGKKGPLSGAFMTINPLLEPSKVAASQPNELLWKLNKDSTFPLIRAQGQYSVQVATFTGRSTTPIGSSQYRGNESRFDQQIQADSPISVNRAGEDAEQLCAALRSRKIEAYVHHDQYVSVVTVGAFDKADDPRIAKIVAEFSPKVQSNPQTGQVQVQPEILTVSLTDRPKAPSQSWAFDPQPHMVAIPKYRRK
jgi:hypothetical protein